MTYATEYERYMLDLINADRAKVGAGPLQLEQNLNQSAEDHSEWMLKKDIFSHTGQGGSSETGRMREAGFNFSGAWGSAENISVQTERGKSGIKDDVSDLHDSLMASSVHYRNLMDHNMKYVGIGIEVGGFDYGSGETRSVIVTQNFAATGGRVDTDGGTRATKGNNTLNGTSSADRIAGGFGNDKISGKSGQDRLFGDSGNDALKGGNGKDRLSGDGGDDRLFGGDGADRFIFGKGDDNDVIRDFENNRDSIDLRDFGYRSVNQALKDAKKSGDDVVFSFGNGDKLKVLDVTQNQLENDLIL